MKILFFLLIIFILYSCKKQGCLRKFEFHFPATITQGDTFNIGDTIWMEMNLPTELVDHQTGEWININEFDLYLELGISKLDTMYVTGAVQDFELIEAVGSFTQKRVGSFIDTYAYFKSITEKHLLLGIVPKKKGVYGMSLSLPIAYALAEESLDTKDDIYIFHSTCRQGIVEYSGTRFQGGSFNYYLIKQSPCQQASPTDNLMVCSSDSISMAHRGGHVFVVR